jgi:hypothetical protein
MSMKIRSIIGLALAFSVGYLSAAVVPPSLFVPTLEQGARLEADSQSEADRLMLAQLGFRCSTPQGICSLPRPQPIGSPCRCEDGRSGTTIR